MEAHFMRVGERPGCHDCRHVGSVRMYGERQSKAHVYCALHRAETSKFAICDRWEACSSPR